MSNDKLPEDIDLPKEIASQAINAFFLPIMIGENEKPESKPFIEKSQHRYRSWEICWEKFNSKSREKPTQDELALHLAFYLASWGMYRGSSFLLQRNYLTHLSPAKILTNSLKNINSETDVNIICEKLFGKNEKPGLWKELADEYRVIPKYTNNTADDEDSTYMTDTLFSKIVLGVNGCIPAFDRYYKCGVSHFKGIQTLGPNSITQIYNYWNKNKPHFEKTLKEIKTYQSKTPYPPMKLMDMCFFTIGMGIDLNNACYEAIRKSENIETALRKYYAFLSTIDLNYEQFLKAVFKVSREEKVEKPKSYGKVKTIVKEEENYNCSIDDIISKDISWIKDIKDKTILSDDKKFYAYTNDKHNYLPPRFEYFRCHLEKIENWHVKP